MRRANKHILIIPEGWCEYNYAQTLKSSLARDKQRSISIEMPKPDNENKPDQLLKKALNKIKKSKDSRNPYDDVWTFFDNDNQPGLSQFFQKLNPAAVKIAYSSICIEHWFILHLADNRQPYRNGTQALTKIKKLWQAKFNRPYHKTKINHFSVLKTMLPKAVERAGHIQKSAENNGIPIKERNPYFTLHEFIEFFQRL